MTAADSHFFEEARRFNPGATPAFPTVTPQPTSSRPTSRSTPFATFFSTPDGSLHVQKQRAYELAKESDRRMQAMYDRLRGLLDASGKKSLLSRQLEWLADRSGQTGGAELLKKRVDDQPLENYRRFTELNNARTTFLESFMKPLP